MSAPMLSTSAASFSMAAFVAAMSARRVSCWWPSSSAFSAQHAEYALKAYTSAASALTLVCKSCNKPVTCETRLTCASAAPAHKRRKNPRLVIAADVDGNENLRN